MVTEIQIAEVFLNNAPKTIKVLEAVYSSKCRKNDDISTFITNVHSMKSALIYVKEHELSAAAKKLEKAGRDKNIDQIMSELPVFINALKDVVKKLKIKVENKKYEKIDENSEEGRAYLREKLRAVQTAAASFDKLAAEEIIEELRKKAWPQPVKEALDAINNHILHSELEEAAKLAGDFAHK